MSEYKASKPISFDELADSDQEDGTALRLWDKAWKIMSADKKLLTSQDYAGSSYLVSPSVLANSGKRYAVATRLDRGKRTKTLFIIVNDRFDKLVLINKEGHIPPLQTDTAVPEEVLVGDIDVHLDSLVRETQRLASQRKGRIKKAVGNAADSFNDAVDEYGKYVGYIGALIGVILAIVGIGVGLAYAAGGNTRYAERFDAEHADYVLRGELIKLGEERMLVSTPQDASVNLPKSPNGEVQSRPRWVTITAGTCEVASTVEDIGYIDGTQQLVASTSAPTGIIRVRVAKDGLVDICAHNPEGRTSEHKQSFMVSLQAVPLSNN